VSHPVLCSVGKWDSFLAIERRERVADRQSSSAVEVTNAIAFITSSYCGVYVYSRFRSLPAFLLKLVIRPRFEPTQPALTPSLLLPTVTASCHTVKGRLEQRRYAQLATLAEPRLSLRT
jgi:hypothetical protein